MRLLNDFGATLYFAFLLLDCYFAVVAVMEKQWLWFLCCVVAAYASIVAVLQLAL